MPTFKAAAVTTVLRHWRRSDHQLNYERIKLDGFSENGDRHLRN